MHGTWLSSPFFQTYTLVEYDHQKPGMKKTDLLLSGKAGRKIIALNYSMRCVRFQNSNMYWRKKDDYF